MVEQYFIKDQVSFNEMKSYILEDSIEYNIDGNKIKTKEFEFELDTPFQKYINDFNKSKSKYSNDLIFGKDKTENVVAVEMFDQKVILFFKDGTIEERPFVYWVLTNRKVYKGSKNLKGDLHYKFITTFKSKESYDKFYYINKKRCDIYRVYDEVESAMIYYGITLFKGMTIDQLSLLSFDIEASGLARDNNSKVYLITNTSRINGKIERRQFREDHYKSMGKMLLDWCKYVREIDPDIILGHNIFGYDFDFMNHVAQNEGISLHLGRDGSEIMFNDYESNYRVDGSQSWKYKKCFIHGRIVFDTMFSSVKYDIGRNYPSWKLKEIIEYEGLIKKDRQFYDASKIREDWKDLKKRELIIKYGMHDADDSLALFDKQAPSFFYMTQSIPKSFQTIICSASGSWLNAILVRGYLQQDHSIPKTEELSKVSGGISFGVPGLHENVFKIDIKSMYPSIIRAYKLYSNKKDPKKYYLEMANYFTEQRFYNKDKYKETNDKYYDDMQASQKILINSLYGLCGTPGLNFNDFSIADKITGIGRQIIKKTIKWASGKNIKYWWQEYNDEKDFIYEGIIDE